MFNHILGYLLKEKKSQILKLSTIGLKIEEEKNWENHKQTQYLVMKLLLYTFSELTGRHMGGTRQEGKRPKNWEFYPLRIGFSGQPIYFLLC